MTDYARYLLLSMLLIASAGHAVAAQKPDLAALAFMVGHWTSPGSNNAEEVWLAANSGTMTGSFRWVIPGGPHVLEYLVIQQTERGVVLRFKHFRPDYSTWEEEANYYELLEAENNRAVFVSRGDNQRVPERMIYSSTAPGHLQFRGETKGDDKPLILEFVRKNGL